MDMSRCDLLARGRGLLVIFLLRVSYAPDGAGAADTLIGMTGDGHYRVSVSDSELASSPVWPAGADNPPLSACDVLKRTSPIKEKMLKDSESIEWRLKAVILRQNGRSAEFKRWYWVVDYAARPKPNHGASGKMEFFVIVLMDGRVIEPVAIGRR
jgi:hypothetical protein